MPEEGDITSGGLTEEQDQVLTAFLDIIIPASADGRMPSAKDVGFLTYLYDEKLISWVREGLQRIIEEFRNDYDIEFLTFKFIVQRQFIIDRLRRKYPRFFNDLASHVIKCYYQNDDVLRAIGLEARPPFPLGHRVKEGDLMLLGPVYDRGKIYRDV